MLNNKTLVKVKNRTDRRVGYSIPDLNNLRRQYTPGEVKEVTMEELRKLSYIGGGDYILKNYLQINEPEAVEELVGEVEPEYFYSREDVEKIINNGSLDAFEDLLDFAPSGVIDLVKEIAVKTELNDVKKRKAIFEKTGLNVDKAIDFEKEVAEAKDQNEKKTRRVKDNVIEETPKKVRRTSLPDYSNVVIKKEE